MEYFRDVRNQIQADVAYRIGRIAIQYARHEEILQSEERFEATLWICLLQTLLTYCKELIDAMSEAKQNEISYFEKKLTDESDMWGLTKSMVVVNTFSNDELTYNNVIEHLRHATSHPSSSDIDMEYPRTGYSSLGRPNQSISAITFIHSPNIRSKKSKPTSPKIFRMDIPVQNLFQLVIGLSNHLSQPIIPNWDGVSVVDLIRN